MTPQQNAKLAICWLEYLKEKPEVDKYSCNFIMELLRPIAAETHVIVPIEPTNAMLHAGWTSERATDRRGYYAIILGAYRAMIASSQEGE